jgi:hypothetical protein
MRTSWSSRLRALLLALLFLGGGTGLPVADGLVYHASGRAPLGIHIEAAGALCHGESCALLSVLPVPRAAVLQEATLRTEPITPNPAKRPTAVAAPRTPSRTALQPRAPPAA